MPKAHSKFSASGAERWFNCSASVKASEGEPDRETEWSREGTFAHAMLEAYLLFKLKTGAENNHQYQWVFAHENRTMQGHVYRAGDFILQLGQEHNAEILVETRIWLTFIHKDAFGTFDGAILDHFGTLHVFDFKYGAGHAVSPHQNLQMIFYALGLAYKYQWNFKRVRLWIIQPRVRGYDGPTFWEISIEELLAFVPQFRQAVSRVLTNPTFNEGPWCHWCKGKRNCPLKQQAKLDEAKSIFQPINEGINNGNEKGETESGKDQEQKSEADWRKTKKKKAKGRRRQRDGFGVPGRKVDAGPFATDGGDGDNFY